MRKFIYVLLALTLLVVLFGCGGDPEPQETQPAALSGVATQEDIDHLESLYAGRTPYYGEMHDHSASGGRSDGKVDLSTWKMMMTNFPSHHCL